MSSLIPNFATSTRVQTLSKHLYSLNTWHAIVTLSIPANIKTILPGMAALFNASANCNWMWENNGYVSHGKGYVCDERNVITVAELRYELCAIIACFTEDLWEFIPPIADAHALVPDHVLLWKMDLHQTCTTLHQSASIWDVLTAIYNRRLSGLVFEHVQKQSALMGEFCTHLQSYKIIQVTYRPWMQSSWVLLAFIYAYLHF